MVLVIGMIASVVLVFMSLSSKRNLIVLFSSIVSVLTLAQYALLDRWATAILSVITLMYGLTIPFEKKFPWLRSKISTIILGIVYSAAFFSVNGFKINIELLAYVASLLGTIIMALENRWIGKWMMFVSGLCWLGYQFSVGAYGQLPGEIFFTVGNICTLFMLWSSMKRGVPLNEVKELPMLLKEKIGKMVRTPGRTVFFQNKLRNSSTV